MAISTPACWPAMFSERLILVLNDFTCFRVFNEFVVPPADAVDDAREVVPPTCPSEKGLTFFTLNLVVRLAGRPGPPEQAAAKSDGSF
jgi:hypothetical protein